MRSLEAVQVQIIVVGVVVVVELKAEDGKQRIIGRGRKRNNWKRSDRIAK